MSILDNFFGKKEETSKIDNTVNVLKNSNTQGKYNELFEYINSKKFVEDFSLLNIDEQCDLIVEMAKNIDRIGEIFHINDIVELYNIVVASGLDEEKATLLKMVKLYSEDPELFRNIKDVYLLFERPIIVYSIYTELLKNKGIDYKHIFKYIKEGKQYNIDDAIFANNIQNLIQQLVLIPGVDEDKINDIIEKQLRLDMHLAGGYDVDESRLVDFEKRYDQIHEDIDRVNNKIDDVDEDIKKISLKAITISETATKAIQDTVDRRTKEFSQKAESLSKDVANSHEKLKNFLETAKEELNNVGETWIKLINSAPVSSTNQNKVNGPTIITRNIKSGDARFTRPTDTPILRKENLQMFLDNKNPNEYYHPAFDELLDHTVNMESTMLIGPHGCGKTHMVKQLSQITGLRFFNFGFVADEYSLIKGYNDANGNYVVPPFYEVFKYGGIALFDEVDASESKALIETNKITSGPGEYEAYEFANNEVVEPHPNFFIVMAANTWGDGTNRVYSTREKLDPGTLDRYEPLEMYYDIDLEKSILKNYPDMYKLIMSYRHSLEELGIPMVISTRGIQAVKGYLDRNMDLDKIFEKRFIRNLSIDQLNKVIANMKDCPDNLLNKFNDTIKQKTYHR